MTEVIAGLVSAFLAFLLGLVWNRTLNLLAHLKARRFWRSLIAEQLSVVLGRFRDLPGFEASGVVGAGDNQALHELSDYFVRIGFKRFTVFYNDQFNGAGPGGGSPLQGNLVLLGGPDANSVTREVLTRLTLGIEFVEISRTLLDRVIAGDTYLTPRPATGWYRSTRRRRTPAEWRVPVFLDRTDERLHGPVLVGDDIRTDCGVVIRCRNPFNPAKEVVILCGSYGYGTWGAVRFVQSFDFLRSLPRGTRALECLLAIDVTHEMPQGARVQFLRPLDHHLSSEPVPVPRIIE